MKKLMLGTTRRRPEAMAGELGLEVLLASPGIAGAVAHVVELERAAPEDGVVSAAGVLDHRHHLAGPHRPQHRSLAEVDVALELDRVRRVVALFGVVGVEAEEVDRLLTLEIDEHEVLAPSDPPAPRPSRPDHGVLEDGARAGGYVRLRCGHGPASTKRSSKKGRRHGRGRPASQVRPSQAKGRSPRSPSQSGFSAGDSSGRTGPSSAPSPTMRRAGRCAGAGGAGR